MRAKNNEVNLLLYNDLTTKLVVLVKKGLTRGENIVYLTEGIRGIMIKLLEVNVLIHKEINKILSE